ncbi:hypothetical protein KC318_g419 [Hortaea werneckii]|nr:hypothetical protein KC334_g668 [Hortaea werneckii]KAI7026504.1 hypothetical protein KC355_g634 [Hortaea werneckii]KAI7197577.1 hypothetical protein KC324_g4124 [Hortaea werneckii]KAI7589236.1 hypothetical protein KC316_g4062 [Hortaea werneckii]KAI7676204.1 hypothetical protein KC318_g419 [Hortaea werneckii]
MSGVLPFAQSAKTSPKKAQSDSEDESDAWETWISKDHKELLDLLKEMDYGNALTKIAEMESRTAVRLGVPRLQGNKWENVGLMCLASADARVLQAVVDLTLPQRVANGELSDEVRKPALGSPLWKDKPDPVIYIQFMADVDGRGLTCAETLEWIDAMEIMAGLKPDDASHDRPGQTLSTGVNRAYWSRRNTHGYKPFLQSVDKQYKSMQTVVSDVAKVYREIVAEAEADGLDHIMIRPEVGWAWQGYDRCRAHHTLDESSPPAFRLAQCVLVHLFPKRHFQLHQYVLFDVMSEDGAAVGESLGHQIGASYAQAYGGWNIAQAGISVQKSWSTTNQDWADFHASYNGQKYQEKIQENLEEITRLYGERIAAAQEQIALRQAEDDVKNEQAEASFAEARLNFQARALHDGMADLRRQSMLLESEMERLDENLSDENVIEDAAREFLTDLGL